MYVATGCLDSNLGQSIVYTKFGEKKCRAGHDVRASDEIHMRKFKVYFALFTLLEYCICIFISQVQVIRLFHNALVFKLHCEI